MHDLSPVHSFRGGSLRSLPAFIWGLVAVLVCLSPPLFADERQNIKLLYFFSTSCPHCIQARPYVIELAKKYPVEGLQYGTDADGGTALPFPVAKGDDAAKKRYNIKGVPVLVMLQDGAVRRTFVGLRGILYAPVMLDAYAKGAMTVSEALGLPRTGQQCTVTGWVAGKGPFKNATFYLTDGEAEIKIMPWLPREAVKSLAGKQGLRTMADVVNVPLVLKGTVQWGGEGPVFRVEEEVRNGK